MKPKTKIQKRIVELSRKLPGITNKQKEWAFDNCLEKIGYRYSRVIICLECRHRWKDEPLAAVTSETCNCPGCGKKLVIKTPPKRTFNQVEYFSIITTCKEFQVIRFFFLEVFYKTTQSPVYFCNEVVQRWICPNGKFHTMALFKKNFGVYYDNWDFGSNFEIKPSDHAAYRITAIKIYPERKYIPEIIRNGFDGSYHGFTPFNLFKLILSNNKAETLLKANQYGLLRYCHNSAGAIEKFWPSIKICIRNNYLVENVPNWIDYLKLLVDNGKDIHNPKYVCPVNLMAAHDRLVEKKMRILIREKIENRKKEIAIAEKEFVKLKEKFFDLDFSDGLIRITPLKSVEEFLVEAERHHHCLFVNEYYLKPDSLILSAKIEDRHLETIEVSLTSMNIVQCRGTYNQISPYHDRIVNLMKQNLNLIERKISA